MEINCSSCGAPLEPPASARVIECSYCGRKLQVSSGQAENADDAAPVNLIVDLLQGYSGRDHGDGQRYGVVEMRGRDWKCWERGVWPIDSHASSSFGLGWSAKAIHGAPTVYPRCGDKVGAWAPRSRTSAVEWIEASYDSSAPPVEAIRVFETCTPGATFAVTIREPGSDRDELVWQSPPEQVGNRAQVVEIRLDPPRRVRSARAYIKNSIGSHWSEIDTIGLVATTPVAEELRKKPSRAGRWGWMIALLVISVAGIIFFTLLEASSQSKATITPVISTPARIVTGQTMKVWNADALTMAEDGTVWASTATGVSSQYGAKDWSPAQALGAPNVLPIHGDNKRAWAPKAQNRGGEWISVRFAPVAQTGSIVIVETFNPGAVVRIDDLSDPAAPVVLWNGTTQSPKTSRVLSLELGQPRAISEVRVVLDTSKVSGWNEIDAIGLVPRQ